MRNEGGGGLRMGIRGKSRGGTTEKIEIMEQGGNKTTNKTVLVNVNNDPYSKKAYIQIPYSNDKYNIDLNDKYNIDLIISGTGDGLTDTDLLEKISGQWRYTTECDFHDQSKSKFYLTNVLTSNSVSSRFDATDATFERTTPRKVEIILEKEGTKYDLKYQIPDGLCEKCGNYLTHMQSFHNMNHDGECLDDEGTIHLCGSCSVGHCCSCGSQLNPLNIGHTGRCDSCGADNNPYIHSDLGNKGRPKGKQGKTLGFDLHDTK